jgi:hypothetical protein
MVCVKRDYWIDAHRLAETRPGSNGTRSDWLLHLGEKTWIDLDDLVIAWLCAVRAAKTDLRKIDVYASIADARRLHARMVKEGAEEQEMERKAGYLPGEPVAWTFINGELRPMPKVTEGG